MKRRVLITGSITANASTMFSNISDYEPMVKQALINNGWDVIAVKLVGSWLSYTVSVAIEANVLNEYSLDQVRQSAVSVLSNIYYHDSYVFDGSYPIFTNVFLAAANATDQQIQNAFQNNNTLDELAQKARDEAKGYLAPLLILGLVILILKD